MFRDQLKRFFYRMKVTSYDGQHTIELPESILKLITDVTISEASYSDADGGYPSLAITLNETLTSPAPGAILDLRFDSEQGFTYISKDEMESGLYRSKRDTSAKPQPVVFVFGGNNKIEIEWGLLEPTKVSRKREFSIQSVNVQGGGNGHGTVTINAMDGRMTATKINIDKGISYVDPVRHYSLKQVLWFVTRAMGIELWFDGQHVNAKPPFAKEFVAKRTQIGGDTAPADPSTPIVHPRGMSLHEFVKDLANEYSSAYEYGRDQFSGKEALYFTYREMRYKSVDRTFSYKSTDDVVLSYKVDSVEGSFNPVTGASSTVDGGEISASLYMQLVEADNKQGGAQKQATDKVPQPANPNQVKQVKDNLDRNYVGQSVTSPSNDPAAVQNEAESLYAKSRYMSALNLTTLGHPDYKPGLIQMENIGRRYSKKYRMFTVQHKLNNSGYQCTWSGMSHYDTDAGVNADDAARSNQESAILQIVK